MIGFRVIDWFDIKDFKKIQYSVSFQIIDVCHRFCDFTYIWIFQIQPTAIQVSTNFFIIHSKHIPN